MYDHIVHYYDLVHRELTADIEFALKLGEQTGGPLLELGCGTGRLLIPLAQAGHEITGLDRSPVMLARAREKLNLQPDSVRQRVTLIEQDMSSFSLDQRFGLAIFPHNTLMHLDRPSVKSSLVCIRRHLNEGGCLLIDVDNPTEMAETEEDDLLLVERTMVDPLTGEHIIQMASSWADTEAQLRRITWIFDALPADGGPVRRSVSKMDFHYLFPHQLQSLLESSGFNLSAIYGNYQKEPYGEESEQMILLAETTKPSRES